VSNFSVSSYIGKAARILSPLLIYIPGAIILCVSLFALYMVANVTHDNHSLYWSVWTLGLTGFILVIINISQLRSLKASARETQDALVLMETQLQSIQNAERDKEALKEQLHQAQKLEAIGRLAGGIAHDFNNILAAMNGYAEFLIDDLDKDSDQHGFARNILTAGKQAGDLVEKMLAFSRRDASEMKEMHLSESIDETVSMLRASLPKTVEFESEIADADHMMIGSQNLISQALMNLCVNAKDALPNEKGRLMVSMALADLSNFKSLKRCDELPDDNYLPFIGIEDISATHTCLSLGRIVEGQDYVCLSVADSGSGMSHAIMENIFEPFFTTKPVDQGTGLGLAMVHGVIASHKGAMVINSIAGKGTRFDLLFPSVGKKKVIKEQSLHDESWQAVGRILVVDDQESVRTVAMMMLKRMGFETECCDSAQAAMEILREHPDYFNVVVTDHNMPDMTGLELIATMAKDQPTIPFVLMTGYSPEKMEGMVADYPMVRAILKKPLNRDELLKAVQAASIEHQFAA